MGARTEIGGGVGAALVLVLVIAGLAKAGERAFGLKMEELVLLVSGMTFVWAVVIGIATLGRGKEQKRLAERQEEQEERWRKREELRSLEERRYRVVEGVVEHLSGVMTRGGKGASLAMLRVLVEGMGRGAFGRGGGKELGG